MLTNGVNFFGHAAVASWSTREPAALLGAMLPDFATMSGGRLADADEPVLAAGIALHHATDAAFHELAVVVALMRELDERLAHGGCTRGPRRAVGHIGVELLLDGVLVDDEAFRASYAAGIAHDSTGIRWRSAGDDTRFARLLERLRTHGVPDDLRRPQAIALRLHRVLAHRPLLAPTPSDLPVIERALVEHKPRVDVAADTVLRGLRAQLSAIR